MLNNKMPDLDPLTSFLNSVIERDNQRGPHRAANQSADEEYDGYLIETLSCLHRMWEHVASGTPDMEIVGVLKKIGEEATRSFFAVHMRSFSGEVDPLRELFKDAVLSGEYCRIAIDELPQIEKLMREYRVWGDQMTPQSPPVLKKVTGGRQASPRCFGHLRAV